MARRSGDACSFGTVGSSVSRSGCFRPILSMDGSLDFPCLLFKPGHHRFVLSHRAAAEGEERLVALLLLLRRLGWIDVVSGTCGVVRLDMPDEIEVVAQALAALRAAVEKRDLVLRWLLGQRGRELLVAPSERSGMDAHALRIWCVRIDHDDAVDATIGQREQLDLCCPAPSLPLVLLAE